MDRRKFLVGVGGASIGGSALVGSGAFTQTASQRQVTIDIAHDRDAYVGLDRCENSPNNSYIEFDDGHLGINMSPENPTGAGGEGVNSDSLSHFDEVFEICNQGKQKACFWIDADIATEHSLPLVDFYLRDVEFDNGSTDYWSLLGEEGAIGLYPGECVCVGVRTYTKMLSAGDQLVEDEEVVITADAEIDCPQPDDDDPDPDPDPRQAISWIAFCGADLEAGDISLDITDTDDDGDPTTVGWSSSTSVDTVVVFGASRLYNTAGGTGGTVSLGDGNPVEWGPMTEQRPPSPCPDGECGPKFEWNGSFNLAGHQDECND